MTEIVTATNNFNIDFQYSFQDNIDTVSGTRWNLALQRLLNDGVDFDLIDKAKLVIFTGGEDINPAIYGHTNEYSYFDFDRDISEIVVLEYALNLGKKILGVCRGHQLINAYLGGELVQDLTLCLNSDHNYHHTLDIVEEGGAITEIFSEVNSLHHQGVTKVGKGLRATSIHKGVIESCESSNIITTQFHPEFMDGKEAEKFFDHIKYWANIGE